MSSMFYSNNKLKKDINFKKNIILITYDRPSLDHYLEEIKNFFEDTLEIGGYCLLEGIDKNLECDVILTLSPIITDIIKELEHLNIEIIHGTRTIEIESYVNLRNLPNGISVMLVSTNKIFALDLASFLYKVGLNNVNFVPVYPKLAEVPDLDIAVTAAQLPCVPKRAKKIIDIGWRLISTSTFMTLIATLKLTDKNLIRKLNEYSKTVINLDFMNTSLDRISKLENLINVVINQIDCGIIITNKDNKVIYINEYFISMININCDCFNTLNLTNNPIFREIYLKINEYDSVENLVMCMGKINKEFIVSKKPIELYGSSLANAIIVKDATQVQELERYLRGQLKNKGYVAKYTFDNVWGISSQIKQCISQAKKISTISKSVLIFGESGTGKEIFAQSIHNFSNRKNKPFVAINCASIPSELLESELFGHEEGSFTGSKKGGKRGLFEVAHTGTFFLDEIGDINLNVQAKLLRVLEEKEVMRVGGNNITPIDVRIIAATNKNLQKLINEGKFREDLYYRLNIFTLILPPLRERIADIPLIADNIIANSTFDYKKISSELMDVLCKYDWKGNVRELKNCMEYMIFMGGKILTVNDLPKNIYNTLFFDNNKKKESFYELSLTDKEIAIEIITVIKFRSLGRRSIHNILISKGFDVSENKIRNILNYLQKNGMLTYGAGRTGAVITEYGLKMLDNLKY